MSLWQALAAPFFDFGFMRRALAGALVLAFGAAPLGVFLVLRRMSLMGDAMSHAILPGVAAGYLLSGLSLGAMMAGGIVTGLAVALLSGLVTRLTPLREDASFAAFYLISLALGVLLVSLRGSNVDLLHVLFGTVLGLGNDALWLAGLVSTLTLFSLAALYRLLVAECFDPGFLRAAGGRGWLAHFGFLALVVVNLVAGFQILGTLMVVGMMMLPALAARFWARRVATQMPLAVGLAALASWAGLLASFHFDLAASPAIILAAGLVYLLSLTLGPQGGLCGRRHGPAFSKEV
ncbi:ABC 3 transport family protein [Bordetella hinzii 5132]|uniref:metal ABC transporter permease n=1 Tax=Bordetella hinzii TaxID=103855 RepID=UPI00045A1B59|nr:metal ABC transporter permease [Bordetella hinzii]KCB42650.1 ABC 3 transport family protein [Bordetella hinzii 5132]QWF40809.1 metal ABC transporter permease [Bordetella hinzii]QWF45357.1 metal ABC transporter permease [Bordetella hinzii]QWF49893.1 metal ABC transporter permease [Bordetella hinzii]QWF54428.1 metal ABC transporter permease [Bordetella hinzii]